MRIFYKRARTKCTPSNKSLTNIAYKEYQFKVENANSIIVHPLSNTKFLIELSCKHLQIVELLKVKEDKSIISFSKCTCKMYQDYKALYSYALAAIKHFR